MAKVKDPKIDAQIHHGRRRKLRQSFINYGLHTFNETQVLEFALGMTMPRIDTNPTAHRLINTFGSLDGVISAHPDKLRKVPGVGEQAACFLRFLKEFVIYTMAVGKKDKKIQTPAEASEILREVMAAYPTEHFMVLCLDKSGSVILRQNVRGNLDKVDVNLREIIDAAFRVNAASVVCAHNHLDGRINPSDADIHLTRTLVNVLFPLGINLLDHIIFGEGKEYSFARSGILDLFRREHKAYAVSKDFEDVLPSITSQDDWPSGN